MNPQTQPKGAFNIMENVANGRSDSDTTDNTTEHESVDRVYLKGLEFLKSMQSEQGWWPYKPGNGASLEATAWCSIASITSGAANEKNAHRTAQFFATAQNKDGGWPTAPGAGFSDWVTGPTLLAFRMLSKHYPAVSSDTRLQDSIERALLYISDSRVEFYPPVARLLLFAIKGKSGVEYSRGWPWDPHCFHWVEPTSYHLMAIKVPGIPPEGVFKKVTEFANRFLIEHPCKGGGWNHGNELSLGAYLPPYRVTTAEALLALQELRKTKVVSEGVAVLERLSNDNSSAMSLAWSILALNGYERNTQKETAFLIERQNSDGSFGPTLMSSALSVLALSAARGENLLKYQEVASAQEVKSVDEEAAKARVERDAKAAEEQKASDNLSTEQQPAKTDESKIERDQSK